MGETHVRADQHVTGATVDLIDWTAWPGWERRSNPARQRIVVLDPAILGMGGYTQRGLLSQ